jgi:hypothetical protein
VKLYVDSETLGLNGPVKLIQYSVDRQPVVFIKLPTGWDRRVSGVGAWGASAKEQLYSFFIMLDRPDTEFVGWNTTFDLWHLYRLRNELCGGFNTEPFKCKVLDLYNHAALKGPFAAFTFAKRGNGRAVAAVRRVPLVAKQQMADRVTARLKSLVPGELVLHEHAIAGRPDLVSLSWSIDMARMGLKAHAEHYGAEVIKLQDVWPLPNRDDERPWDPNYRKADGTLLDCYAAIEQRANEVLAGPEDSPFYNYARNDIEYLWLAEDRLGNPAGDYNDVATHVVAFTRYHGFRVDEDCLERTGTHYNGELRRISALLAGCDLKSHQSRTALLKKYNPIVCSSKKAVLEGLSKIDDECGKVAAAMLKFGSAKQKLDQVQKIASVRHMYPDLRVLGTATGRMAGTGAFNVQGIGKVEVIAGHIVGLREAVYTAAVGDFHQFELAIAATAWGDERLLADLDAGIDVHLATTLDCHPKIVGHKLDYNGARKLYKQAQADGEAGRTQSELGALLIKCRTECKRMVFGILYGCTEKKIAEVFGVTDEEALQILRRFYDRYPGVFKFKKMVEKKFCTADTEHWSAESVSKMADHETDLTGYTRYWKFEKAVACAMWELGNRWSASGVTGVITRQTLKGPQSIDQACRSACLGAAIAIQQAVYRQAANMKIQTTGACLCKMLQAALFEKFRVPMLNVHDELVFPKHAGFKFAEVEAFVLDWVAKHKRLVKHLKFDFKECERWSHKG